MLDLNGGTHEERLAKVIRWCDSHDALIRERWTTQYVQMLRYLERCPYRKCHPS